MPLRPRPRFEPTDDWQQLQLLASFPEQRAYELLRPVVLFGRSPVERTRYRRAARFDAEGMASLFPPPATAALPARRHAVAEGAARPSLCAGPRPS